VQVIRKTASGGECCDEKASSAIVSKVQDSHSSVTLEFKDFQRPFQVLYSDLSTQLGSLREHILFFFLDIQISRTFKTLQIKSKDFQVLTSFQQLSRP